VIGFHIFHSGPKQIGCSLSYSCNHGLFFSHKKCDMERGKGKSEAFSILFLEGGMEG
jgi:hypothetical protein